VKRKKKSFKNMKVVILVLLFGLLATLIAGASVDRRSDGKILSPHNGNANSEIY
jgi:hypothetical protein